jgi:hypothetical protein
MKWLTTTGLIGLNGLSAKKYIMKEIVNKLKKSALFNLSLSSKELFHSNFIYWVANECLNKSGLEEFGELLKSYFPTIPKDSKCSVIEREKGNLDLKFQFNSDRNVHYLILENKVKSSIYLNQLKKYSKGNKNQNTFAVLSLNKPHLFGENESIDVNGYVWFYFSYYKLLKLLDKFTKSKIIGSYETDIIKDYIGFTSSLVEISNSISVKDNQCFHHYDNDDLRELKGVKLHDLYLKKVYEEFAFKVHQKLKKDFAHKLTPFGEAWFNENKEIFVGHGFTRSTGIVEVKYRVSQNFLLGIQIQDNSYKILIESFKTNKKSESPRTAFNIKEDLLNQGLWFDLRHISDYTYPRGNAVFNKYGSTFFYKSAKLSENLTVKEIINYIIRDVKLIDKNQDEIRLLIKSS